MDNIRKSIKESKEKERKIWEIFNKKKFSNTENVETTEKEDETPDDSLEQHRLFFKKNQKKKKKLSTFGK